MQETAGSPSSVNNTSLTPSGLQPSPEFAAFKNVVKTYILHLPNGSRELPSISVSIQKLVQFETDELKVGPVCAKKIENICKKCLLPRRTQQELALLAEFPREDSEFSVVHGQWAAIRSIMVQQLTREMTSINST